MKKILLATAFALTVSLANAQLKYGLKAGVNFANMGISSQGMSFSPKSQTSFHLTGFVDVAISEKFSFQPGLSFQGKGYKLDVDGEEGSATGKFNLGYLEVPLNAVLYLPAGDGNVFIGAGPYAALGLFGKQKYDVSGLGSGDEDVKFGNSEDDDITSMDFGLNFMLGYRLNSGLLFNAGYGLGLANNIPKDLRENDLKYKHKVFSISVGYSF